MRMLRRLALLAAAALVSLLPSLGTAQMTSFTAASVNAGSAPITGKLCLEAVDRYGNPISITRQGGGYYKAGAPFCGNLTAGALATPISLPDSHTDSASGHGYLLIIYDSTTHLASDPQVILGVTGSTWALDTYIPSATVSTTNAFTLTAGTSVPSGSCIFPALYTQLVGSNVATWACGQDGQWHAPASAGGGTGSTGPPGAAATVSVGTVTTLAPGSPATVTNGGSSAAAVLNFGIPQGAAGSSSTGHVLAASGISGIHPVTSVQPGTDATGFLDSLAVVNAALSSGISKLVVDAPIGIHGTIAWPSNVEIECTAGMGFIQIPGANAVLIQNKTAISSPSSCAANVSNGAGGYVVSNQCDRNLVMKGCILNQNSTQSITSSDHRTDPTGTFYITAAQMLGVDNWQMLHTLIYDSGSYHYAGANVDHVKFVDAGGCDPSNNGLAPCAIGATAAVGKNTDMYHWNGPWGVIDVSDAVIGPNSDDGCAFNADDWYDSDATNPFGHFTHFAGWSNGTGVSATCRNIRLNNITEGVRVLSSGSTVNEITVDGLSGTTTNAITNVSHFTNTGTCNIGALHFRNITATRGTGSEYGIPYQHYIDCQNIRLFDFPNLTVPPFLGSLPVVYESAATNIAQLNFPNLEIDNAAGVQSTNPLIQLNGTTGKLRASGVTFVDSPSNTGYLFGGSSMPSLLTVSGYSGPSARIMPFPTSGGNVWGDAFIPVVSSSVTYISTTFNEASAGASLNNTQPATTVGTTKWVETTPGSWLYQSGGGVQTSTSSLMATIDPGIVTNRTIHVTRSNPSDLNGFQVLFDYVDPNNYLVVNFGTYSGCTGDLGIYTDVAGTFTSLAENDGCSNTISDGVGTVSIHGTSITATVGTCVITATYSGTQHSPVGINNFAGAAIKLTAFSVDNQ